MLLWQRPEKHRNTTFCNFRSIFHHLTSFSTTSPRDEQFLFYELITNYHPEILYAKYHFVRSVGRHLKIKEMCSEMVKNSPKSAEGALFMVLLRVAMATLVG